MEKKKPKGQLRTGFTTGACAAAATKAAATALKTKHPIKEVEIDLPIGQKVTFAVIRCELYGDCAEAEVIKDAGDDPDCTHGAHIISKVIKSDKNGLLITGGDGVGTITKAGLGLEVGGPAINPVPKKMIIEAVDESGWNMTNEGLEVEIIVPDGEEMAKKTLNDRLGIIGGISILGTTGIVKPYSTAAFKASIAQAIDVSIENDNKIIVLTTGGRSEKFAMKAFNELPEVAFVQMGDFVGFSLEDCLKKKIKEIRICGMAGKMTKIAQGKMMTHAKGGEVNIEMLAGFAKECGADNDLLAKIMESPTARGVTELIDEAKILGFYEKICNAVAENCSNHIKNRIPVSCLLTDFDGVQLGLVRKPVK